MLYCLDHRIADEQFAVFGRIIKEIKHLPESRITIKMAAVIISGHIDMAVVVKQQIYSLKNLLWIFVIANSLSQSGVFLRLITQQQFHKIQPVIGLEFGI